MRVVVAEDDVLLGEGIASLLEESGFDVVGLAGDGPQHRASPAAAASSSAGP